VIAPNPRIAAAAAAALGGRQVAVLVRNAIAAAKWVTLHVHAPRRPEAVQEEEEEATAVAAEEAEAEEAEATVVLEVGAVKKHGALSHVSCLVASPGS
jgi:hypothetical protein